MIASRDSLRHSEVEAIKEITIINNLGIKVLLANMMRRVIISKINRANITLLEANKKSLNITQVSKCCSRWKTTIWATKLAPMWDKKCPLEDNIMRLKATEITIWTFRFLERLLVTKTEEDAEAVATTKLVRTTNTMVVVSEAETTNLTTQTTKATITNEDNPEPITSTPVPATNPVITFTRRHFRTQKFNNRGSSSTVVNWT